MPDLVLMHLLFLSSALHLTVSPYISMRVGQSLSILMDPSIILQCTGTSRIYQLKWAQNGSTCRQSWKVSMKKMNKQHVVFGLPPVTPSLIIHIFCICVLLETLTDGGYLEGIDTSRRDSFLSR